MLQYLLLMETLQASVKTRAWKESERHFQKQFDLINQLL